MLSVVILTHNDERTIDRTLKSLRFCDDIIIFDDESSDRTREKVKKYPHSFIKSSLQGDFATQRNKAMKQAQGEWILFIDADEEVTEPLKEEIEHVLENPSFESYFLPRHDQWWGQELRHGELATAANRGFIRLVRKGSGSWKGQVHEEYVTDKPVGQLKHHLNHYPHPTLAEFIHEVNTYSSLRSQELMKVGHESSIWEIMTVPFLKFIYTYFLKKGFLDGAAGFTYSFMMSFHSFLVRAKLYQSQHIDR
jgi:glycosyltransferase involved in cell wall biosynthesis